MAKKGTLVKNSVKSNVNLIDTQTDTGLRVPSAKEPLLELNITAMPSSDAQSSAQLLRLGAVVKPHGIKGAVKVYTDPNYPDIKISAPGELFMRKAPSFRQTTNPAHFNDDASENNEGTTVNDFNLAPPRPKRIRITAASRGRTNNEYIVSFPKVDSPEVAELLRNYEVYVPASSQPALKPGEYFCKDIFGLKCYLSHTDDDEDGNNSTIAGSDLSKPFAVVSGIVLPGEICGHKPSTTRVMHALLEVEFLDQEQHQHQYRRKIQYLSRRKCYIPFVSALIESLVTNNSSHSHISDDDASAPNRVDKKQEIGEQESGQIVFKQFPGLLSASFVERQRASVKSILRKLNTAEHSIRNTHPTANSGT